MAASNHSTEFGQDQGQAKGLFAKSDADVMINPDELIVITLYVNPQLFCYTPMQELVKNRDLVIHVESQLSMHCHENNRRRKYLPDQRVIVRYLPENSSKLMRGKVIANKLDEYLIWATDYGFTLNCKVKDLWLLPSNLSQEYIRKVWGGVAGITPLTVYWSKSAVNMLESRLSDAMIVLYKVKLHSSVGYTFGQLLIKSTDLTEPMCDAARYLVKGGYARYVECDGIIPNKIYKAAYNNCLAQVNDVDEKQKSRAETIIKLMMLPSSVNKSNLPNFAEQRTKPMTFLGSSEEDSDYIKQTFDNNYHRTGQKARNLTCPSVQSARLDMLLEGMQAPVIPESAQRLSKVKNRNDESIYTALKSCRDKPYDKVLALKRFAEQLNKKQIQNANKVISTQSEDIPLQDKLDKKINKVEANEANTTKPEENLIEKLRGQPMPRSLNMDKLDTIQELNENLMETGPLKYSDPEKKMHEQTSNSDKDISKKSEDIPLDKEKTKVEANVPNTMESAENRIVKLSGQPMPLSLSMEKLDGIPKMYKNPLEIGPLKYSEPEKKENEQASNSAKDISNKSEDIPLQDQLDKKKTKVETNVPNTTESAENRILKLTGQPMPPSLSIEKLDGILKKYKNPLEIGPLKYSESEKTENEQASISDNILSKKSEDIPLQDQLDKKKTSVETNVPNTTESAENRIVKLTGQPMPPSLSMEKLDTNLKMYENPIETGPSKYSDPIERRSRQACNICTDIYKKSEDIPLQEQLDKEKTKSAENRIVKLTGQPMPPSLNIERLDEIMKKYENPLKTVALKYPTVEEYEQILNTNKVIDKKGLIKIDKHIPVELLLFAHSNIGVLPISNSVEGLWSTHNAQLNINYETILPMQRFAWPHLFNGHSLILIDGICSGRSMCYLPVVCAMVKRDMAKPMEADIEYLGPSVLLLADSRANAMALSTLCVDLMGNCDEGTPMVVNSHDHALDAAHITLPNRCGILVTTLTHLKKILLHETNLIDPRRLKCCICDDFDPMLMATPDLIQTLFQTLQQIGVSQTQFVLVAQQWHRDDAFMQLIKRYAANPLLLCGNYLEAAIYGNLKLSLTTQHSDAKLKNLLNYLAKQNRRTLIYCNSNDELTKLRQALTDPKRTGRHEQNYQLILLTDATQLKYRNFESLVYYGLPDSWKTLSHGFHALCDNIKNSFQPDPQEPQPSQSISSLIMLDNDNIIQLPRLVQFLSAHNMPLDRGIAKFAANYRLLTDKKRQFCQNILTSGECVQTYCNKRHFLTEEDYERPILWQPDTTLRCKPINIFSPVHMAVMVTSYKPKDSTDWVDATNPAVVSLRSKELGIYMDIAKNRRIPNELNVNDICVLRRGRSYQRVRLVDTSDSCMILVQSIDSDTELFWVRPLELFECEPNFKAHPLAAIDVRLCGLMPNKDDIDWSPESIKWVKEVLGGVTNEQHLQLTVAFDILNVLFVKEIEVLQDCQNGSISMKSTKLSLALIERNFAFEAPQSTEKLRQLYEAKQAKYFKDTYNVVAEINNKIQAAKTNICGRYQQFVGVAQKLIFWRGAEAETPCKPFEMNESKPNNNEALKRAVDNYIKMKEEQIKKKIGEFNIKEIVGEDKVNFCGDHIHNNEELMKTCSGIDNYAYTNWQSEMKDQPSPGGAMPQLKADAIHDVLECANSLDNTVHPMITWHQTMTEIELLIEQQIPDYQLLHNENVLIYQVNGTTPPQRRILNLLGPVDILSANQVGSQLVVKLLKKHGFATCWPRLFNPLYTQPNGQWLVYNQDGYDSPLTNEGGKTAKELNVNGNSSEDDDGDYAYSEDSCDF